MSLNKEVDIAYDYQTAALYAEELGFYIVPEPDSSIGAYALKNGSSELVDRQGSIGEIKAFLRGYETGLDAGRARGRGDYK